MDRKYLALALACVVVALLVASPGARAFTGGTATLQYTASGQTLACSDPSCTTGVVVVAGSDTLITQYVALAGQTAPVAVYAKAATCGATSMSLLANFTISGASAFSRIYLFYGVGFGAGSVSCGITTSGAVSNVFIYATQAWSNVSQSTPIAQHAQATGTTQTNYTASVASTPGTHDLMVDWNLAMAGTVSVPSPGISQTSQWSKTIAAAIYGRGSTKPTSAVIPKTMYYTSGANAAWGQYVVDVASDFVATPASAPPTSLSGGSYWGSGGQWANGTLVNTHVQGNCVQLNASSASGSWTSSFMTNSLVLTKANLTYSGTDANNYISNLALLGSVSPSLSMNLNVWSGTGTNLTLGNVETSSQASGWQVRITLTSANGGTPEVCSLGLGGHVLTINVPPPFDWLPYVIVAVVFVIIAVLIVAWRYLA